MARSYDSADVELTVPSIELDEDFFDCFSDAFYQYSRFSIIQPAYDVLDWLNDESSSWHDRHALVGSGVLLPFLARFQVVANLQRLRRIQPFRFLHSVVLTPRKPRRVARSVG